MGGDRRSELVEEILGRFTAAGGRRTASRQAIVEAVLGAGGHITAEQIATAVQARFPSVNLSTVYRTLDSLEELRSSTTCTSATAGPSTT